MEQRRRSETRQACTEGESRCSMRRTFEIIIRLERKAINL